jgi:hypothetical protein
MIPDVTEAEPLSIPERTSRPRITGVVPSRFTHSGQRWPTLASIEHEAQIGRPHSVHDRPVGRSGWR